MISKKEKEEEEEKMVAEMAYLRPILDRNAEVTGTVKLTNKDLYDVAEMVFVNSFCFAQDYNYFFGTQLPEEQFIKVARIMAMDNMGIYTSPF